MRYLALCRFVDAGTGEFGFVRTVARFTDVELCDTNLDVRPRWDGVRVRFVPDVSVVRLDFPPVALIVDGQTRAAVVGLTGGWGRFDTHFLSL